MIDHRIQTLANVLIHYSLRLQKGDTCLISASDIAMPLVKEVYREALKAGAYPDFDIQLPGISEILLKTGTDEQITTLFPREAIIGEKYDAHLVIGGDYTTKPLAGVDPQRIALHQSAREELWTKVLTKAAQGTMRLCMTQFPTHSAAQDADMTLEDYETFVYQSGWITAEHPAQKWEHFSKHQHALCEMLNTKNTLRIIAKDTDLRMSVAGRTWINCDGKENFPDGEVFTTPIKTSVTGHIRFSYPAIHAGNEVEDICLTFQDGRVVDAHAAKGEAVLLALLDTDENSRYVGEIGIGTNYDITQFTKNMLFDEKIGGTIHVALGMAYPETGGSNDSGIHWDMLCNMQEGGAIYADDELIYQHGKFISN